jgi:hypothetical protein
MVNYIIIEQCEACPYCERITTTLYYCNKYDCAFPVVRESKKPYFCTTNWIQVGEGDKGKNEGQGSTGKE